MGGDRMSDYFNRKSRIPIILKYPATVTDDMVRQTVAYMQETTGVASGGDVSFERTIDALGYLTVTGGPYVGILASPAFASMVEQVAAGLLTDRNGTAITMPPGVELVRVEWPSRTPEDGWPPVVYQETLADGSVVTRDLPRMS